MIEGCVSLLGGGSADDRLVLVLGGAHARRLLEAGDRPDQAYWLRVWAARGLLWAGPDDHIEPLRAALGDRSWRVREMVCKVTARHLVGDLLSDLARLRDDPVPRVRAAADRAVVVIADARA